MQQFGWAFLGCGGIAHTVARQLSRERGMKIVSCWNRTCSRAAKFAKKYGAAAFNSAEEAVSARGVDGVYIAVTANKHYDLAKMCIERGVPVLLEKPFTVNFAQAQHLFDLAREKGVYIAEAMWTWYNSPALKVREWLREGMVGEVTSVSAVYALPVCRLTENPRHTSPELIGGALMDIGIYPIRYAYELFGMPIGLNCSGALEGGVDFTERVQMRYADFTADIFVSRRKVAGERFVIRGTEGVITVPYFHMASRAILKGKKRERLCDRTPKYAAEFRRVAEEISSGKKESAYCPAQSTLDTMKLLDACRRDLGLEYPCEKGSGAAD